MNQQSEQWFADRAGFITASRLADVLARPATKRHRWYLDQIIAERAGALPFNDDDPPWMRPGKEYEAEARGRYEWEHDCDVTQVGFIRADGFPVGCSPDGFVGAVGGAEIKVRTSAKAYMQAVKAGLPSVHRAQVQGCLWLTGRDWWDYINYYRCPTSPKRALNVHRVYPDKAYHMKLASACMVFMREVRCATKTG